MPAHPAYPPQHMQNARYNYPHPGMYYPVNESGEYNYATPSRPTHQPMPSMTYNGTTPQPPSATMLGRPFDGPMSLPAYQGQPQHTWQTMETPTKAPAQKKKRGRPRKERTTDQLPGSTPQTNAQRLSISSGDSAARATKRAKKDHVAQLPTPPSTGSMPYSNDLPVAHPQSFDMGAPPHQQRQQQQQSQPAAMSSLPPTPQPIQQSVHQPTPQPLHLSQASTGDELRPASTDAARRSALIITKDEQGRKLEVGSAATDPAEGSGQHAEQHSPRYITVPALVTNPAGLVSVDDNEVLQSAMEWLDNRPQTPRSTPGDSAPLRTPVMPHNDILADETTDTPVSRARKVDRRLQAFGAATPARESLLTATSRINRMGRVVAVGKGFATTFLGIEDHARVVEEADMGDMFEIPAASSSLMERKPDWPDQEPPWALGSGRSGKAAREKRERDATIRRYLESASEESSDEEAGWRRTTFRNNKGKGVDRSTDRLNDMSYRKRTQSNWEAATTDATSALLLGLRNRNLRAIPAGVVGCLCGTQDTESRGPMIRCESCKTWHHLSCYNLDQVPHAFNTLFWCSACETRVMAAATTPARTPRTTLYSQSEERSSAFKRQASDIALAPSPLFPTFNQAAANSRTPLSRAIASASSPGRTPRARMLSYNEGEFWNTFEDAAPPSTPTSKADRFSTPKIDDVPFDVTSTPSRHIDFSFGQPSLFSLTPLGGRSRIPSNMLTDNMTPMRARNVSFGAPLTDMVPSRHDFLKDLNRGGNGHAGPSVPAHPYSEGAVPASPSSARWPHGLLGAPHVSPSPFGHRRTASGNKMSSLRSSSKAGLGFAMGDDGTVEEEDDEEY